MNKLKWINISGVSGSGKDTVIDKTLEEFEEKNGYWVSENTNTIVVKLIPETTRDKRTNEIDGLSYHFVDENVFEKKTNNNLEDFVIRTGAKHTIIEPDGSETIKEDKYAYNMKETKNQILNLQALNPDKNIIVYSIVDVDGMKAQKEWLKKYGENTIEYKSEMIIACDEKDKNNLNRKSQKELKNYFEDKNNQIKIIQENTNRMKQRGSENIESLKFRLEHGIKQLEEISKYDDVIINQYNNLEKAVETLKTFWGIEEKEKNLVLGE